MTTLAIKLREWDGASGRTFIQGVKGDVLVAQADDVKGQREQDFVVREHDSKFDFTGRTCTVKRGGHGSSFGEADGWIYLCHELKGFGRFRFVDGDASFLPIKGYPDGDVSVDPLHRLVCVRSGTLYQGWDLDSGKQLFRTVVPDWYVRFQGHYLTKINGELVLLIHRDVKTKGKSELRLLRITSYSKWRTLDTVDTTKMGDEAEGVWIHPKTLRIYVVKRSGGPGAGRIVNLSPLTYKVSIPKVVIDPPKATDPKAAGTWAVVNVNSWLWARKRRGGRWTDNDEWLKRKAGFKVTTGDHFTTIDGVRYLVTRAGRLYTAKYLRKIT